MRASTRPVVWRIASRFLGLAGTLLAVSVAVFVATQVAPGDAAQIRLGTRATPERLEELRAELGTDRSILAQYGAYTTRVLRGDLGTTIDGESVSRVIGDRAPVTVQLVVGGLTATVLFAVPFALVAATRRDRATDHAIRLGALLALFLPSFWVAFVLIRFIALPTGWFPVAGLGDGFGDRLRSLVLPSLTIGLATAPVLIRSLRTSLVEVLDSEYVAVARSLGVRRTRLVMRHVLRNAAAPGIVLLAVQIGYLLFGSVIVEYTFDIQGMGGALVDAARQRDVILVQGITLIFAIAVVVINASGDLVARLLDPRVSAR